MQNSLLTYYSRKDIAKEILDISKNREVAVSFNGESFGKRPDTLQFENDITELVKSGATSFHISEEHWSNPLHLKTPMTKRELDDLRIGWDLVLDIDSKHLEYSKIASTLIVSALKFYNIENISVKFSGNHGFHIAIPYKAFPKKLNNQDTKNLFPEALRAVAAYLKEIIKEHLSARLLSEPLEQISKNINKDKQELLKDNKFDPYSVVDIDTLLISSRHLYRAPYSINEKSGLVSIPINKEAISSFDPQKAKVENIKVEVHYLDDTDTMQGEASNLIIQAFDWSQKLNQKKDFLEPSKYIRDQNTKKIPEQYFPDCIKKILQGMASDGRKRALFVLITFLRKVGYSKEEITKIIEEWNKKNYQQLKEGYLNSQISWHTRQKEAIMPPNCDSMAYYDQLGIKCSYCHLFKNPINYALRMFSNQNQKQQKKKTK